MQTPTPLYEYSGYSSLLFYFDDATCTFVNMETKKSAADYDGVYLNGYLHTPELAFTAATVLDAHSVPYVNSELGDAPSLTKLSSYAKLSKAGVSLPKTYGATASGLLKAHKDGLLKNVTFPCIVKRADADRGIDNFILHSWDAVKKKLLESDAGSIWLLQEFIPNDGYYVATYYHNELKFGVYRKHMERTDRDESKRHMFKPKGGVNATYLSADDVPAEVAAESMGAIYAMKREIGSVDVVVHRDTRKAYVLEVNYNPQLVTVSVYKDERIAHFVEGVKNIR